MRERAIFVTVVERELPIFAVAIVCPDCLLPIVVGCAFSRKDYPSKVPYIYTDCFKLNYVI